MKLNFKKALLLLPVIGITSCGYSLSYLVEGNKYNSPIFRENYYSYWDNEFKNAKLGKAVDQTNFITSYKDIGVIDQKAALDDYGDVASYGEAYRMNKVNDLFNYGYQSKLFDGRVYCGGFYQLSRVQIDGNGFSMSFGKESSELKYVALQFKATTDSKQPCMKVGGDKIEDFSNRESELYHNSNLTLTTNIYYKNDNNEIIKNSYTSTITDIRTNNGSAYVFYAFDLRDENLSRVVGMSYTYEVDDELINYNNEHGGTPNLDYALFLYELFIPYTNWN